MFLWLFRGAPRKARAENGAGKVESTEVKEFKKISRAGSDGGGGSSFPISCRVQQRRKERVTKGRAPSLLKSQQHNL